MLLKLKKKKKSLQLKPAMWTSKNAQNTEAVGIEHSLPQKRVNIQKKKKNKTKL